MDTEIVKDLNALAANIDSPAVNYELLKSVAAYIEAHPGEFDMSDWGSDPSADLPWYKRLFTKATGVTIGCIACHAVRLSGLDPLVDGCNVPAVAQELLRISDKQADALFYTDTWPANFQERFGSAGSSKEMAWLAARRLRHFIATNGAE